MGVAHVSDSVTQSELGCAVLVLMFAIFVLTVATSVRIARTDRLLCSAHVGVDSLRAPVCVP